MSYENGHKNSECDKCLEDVGIENLRPVPFLYKDMNDHVHEDLGDMYHQYYICEACSKEEDKIEWNKFKHNKIGD